MERSITITHGKRERLLDSTGSLVPLNCIWPSSLKRGKLLGISISKIFGTESMD